MDVEAVVAAHREEWARLDELGRKRRLTGTEAEEMLDLYQRAASHLSLVQSTSADPVLTQYLSTIIARARVKSSRDFRADPGAFARFFLETFPAICYRAWRWWAGVGVAFVVLTALVAWWTATHPAFVSSVLSPEEISQLTRHDFEDYYSSYAAQDFAFRVWTNNAWVAALCITLGSLGFPIPLLLWANIVNTGVSAGLMASDDRLSLFFGLILPHGMLELTSIFVAAGIGLRGFWSWIEPGPRSRADAFAAEMRTAFTATMGLVAVLALCGFIEAFVTPSGLPTPVRLLIGFTAWCSFIAYVAILGRRAVAAGVTGDVDARLREDELVAG